MDIDCTFCTQGGDGDGELESYFRPLPGNPLYELPAWLLSAGVQRVATRAYSWPGEARGPSVIWQCTLGGAGALWLDGREQAVAPGQAMFVTTPEAHRYYLPESSPEWEFIFLTLVGPAAFAAAAAIRARYGSVLSLPLMGPTVRAAREILDALRHNRYSSPYEIADAAGHFLCVMSRELEETAGAGAGEPDFLRRIHAALQRDPDLDIDKLTAISGFSRRYLDRRFKECTGESPAGYLRRLRLEKAAWMLENTLLSVKEVAARCGFYDAAYFCRQFSARYGRTPAAGRRR